MAFTHGMNVDEVRTEAGNVNTQADETSTSRGDANDTIHNFVAESWWGPDAEAYLEDWMGTVDPLYAQLAEMLEAIGLDTNTQADQQEECSAS